MVKLKGGKFGTKPAAGGTLSNQEGILKTCEKYWNGVLEFKDAKDDAGCPKTDGSFKDATHEIATFTIQMLKSPEKRKKAGVEWVYASIRLLRNLQKVAGAQRTVTDALLTKENVKSFLGEDGFMTTKAGEQLEDRSAAEMVILYFNSFFISTAKADKLFWEEKTWRAVMDRAVVIKRGPISLNTLYYFTRFMFIMGARETKPAGPVIRKEIVEHKDFVHFLVQCFNELLKDKGWAAKPFVCRGVADVIRVLYNLTLHNKEFILHALQEQPFEKETIDSVMHVLKHPLKSDPKFDPKNFDQVENHSLANAKLELINLLMNTPKVITVFFGTKQEDLEELAKLFEYRVAAAKSAREMEVTCCPFLMLIEQACLESPQLAHWWKTYLWGEDATNGRKNTSGDMGGLRTAEEGTLRNNLLDFMTHVNFQLKACTGKMLLAICGNETEFFRLAGVGNAIGTMQMLGKLPNVGGT